MTVPFGACVVQALAPITPGQPAAASTSADAEKSRSGGDGVIKRTSKGVLRVVSRRDREGGKRAPLRQSIEAMFTDEGLKKDSALAKLLSDSTGGWVDLDALMELKRIKALKAKRKDVLRALRDSWLELKVDTVGGAASVRRSARRSGAKAGGDTGGASGGGERRLLFPGRLTGTISSYDEITGDACIDCVQTKVLFQRDIQIDWRDLEQSSIAVHIGSIVSFLVEMGPDGAPRAKDLHVDTADVCSDGLGDNVGGKRKKTAPGTSAKDKGALVGERFVGRLKSFHDGIGVGFVQCKPTHVAFGRDVSITREDVAGFEVGEAVSFILSVDAELGTPQAKDLEAAVDTEVDFEDAAADADEAEEEIAAPPQKSAKMDDDELRTRRFKGVVKSLQPSLKLGKIDCSDFPAPVAVDEGELAGFAIGDAVSFRIQTDDVGTKKAFELEAE